MAYAPTPRSTARARDLRTNPDGTTEVVGEAWFRATVSPQHNLLCIETMPDVPALQELIGASVGSGFRSRVNGVVERVEADGCQDGSLLYLLLDDLPGATLVSGYSTMPRRSTAGSNARAQSGSGIASSGARRQSNEWCVCRLGG